MSNSDWDKLKESLEKQKNVKGTQDITIKELVEDSKKSKK